MVILFVGTLCIFVLAMTLSTLICDEKKRRSREMNLVKLKGYWSGDDRRSTDRLNISFEVKCIADGKVRVSKSMDISAKGIRLLLDERFEKGIPLVLSMRLPGRKKVIKASGMVVWTSESNEDEKNSPKRLFNTGIKFFRFQNAGEKELFDFMHSLDVKSA